MSQILEKFPWSTQNPPMVLKKFHDYCSDRFTYIPKFKNDFEYFLSNYEDLGFLEPAFVGEEQKLYVSYQTYQLFVLERARAKSLKSKTRRTKEIEGKEFRDEINTWEESLESQRSWFEERIKDFECFFEFLIKVQDLYLPEVRSNGRRGLYIENGPKVKGGTHFNKKVKILISQFRAWRQELISDENYNPQEVLENLEISVERLEQWIDEMGRCSKLIDPMQKWHMFTKFFSYNKKQDLEGSALLASDFFEMAEVTKLFLEDLDDPQREKEYFDLYQKYDVSPRDDDSGLPAWKQRKYGEQGINNPQEMIEFLTNEFDVNARPRAILFTEGDEYLLIKEVFRLYGYDPDDLGIEFRSIEGEGEFKLHNWRCFIEYMHEKQVLIYFAIDKDSDYIVTEADNFVSRERKFEHDYLEKVFPDENVLADEGRIQIWNDEETNDSCFESVNFTDEEISQVLREVCESTELDYQIVKKYRENDDRQEGLLKAIIEGEDLDVSKGSLYPEFFKWVKERISFPNPSEDEAETSLEKFVLRVAEEVMLNHLPTGKEHRERNFETGLLG